MENGIAILTMANDGKPNIIDRQFLFDLKINLVELEKIPNLRGFIITGTPDSGFLAGMDIKHIEQVQTYVEVQDLCNLAHSVYALLTNVKGGVPSVALINGACLGGGYELALSCKYRIAIEGKYPIGLPEINLGIIPAFGGCSKLPMLIGFRKAIDIICGAKQMEPHKAQAIGLIDSVCWDSINACAVACECIEKSIPVHKYQRTFWDRTIGRCIWKFFSKREILKKTNGVYPAPLAALELIYNRYNLTEDESLYFEKDAVSNLLLDRESPAKNIMKTYLLQESRRKDYPNRPASMKTTSFQDAKNIGIVGAGFMGGGIAQTIAYKGMSAYIKDINDSAIQLANSTINDLTAALLHKKLINESKQKDILSNIHTALSYDNFEKADIVIEAVIERMDVKKKVIAELDAIVSDNCIIATNTSSLSITEIAKQSKHPERVIGLHFFSPVHKMQLVEIVPGEKTSAETIDRTFRFATKLGKVPVVCFRDAPCFIVNRILGAYMNEALWCLIDGYPVAKVDAAMRSYGMPVGPFELMDEVGIPVVNEVGKQLIECYPGAFHDPKLLPLMIANKLCGKRASKEGFYTYAAFKKTQSHNLDKILAQLGSKPKCKSVSERIIIERLLFAMHREAHATLYDGVALKDDINLAMTLGAGYPVYRGRLIL